MPFDLPSIWVDGWNFGRALLLNGSDPWDDPATLGHFLRNLKGLLRLQVADINLDSLVQDCDAIDSIEDALCSADLAERVKEAIASAQGISIPVCLSIAGPAALAMQVGEAGDEDAIDDIAMALADFARAAAGAGAQALLLREPDDSAFEFMTPLSNVCQHNGLSLCVVTPQASDETLDGITAQFVSGEDAGLWHGEEVAAPSYTIIPETANAETVQSVLDRLG